MIDSLESRRRDLQAQLDAEKTQAERNKLGQFSTPSALAIDILRYMVNLIPARQKISFLDPAIGTGVFYSAFRSVVKDVRIAEAMGVELDPYYGKPAAALWSDVGLKYKMGDFTSTTAAPRFNLIVCNPPYVRHHHLENGYKIRLQRRTAETSGMKLSGLSGLYCHFLGLSHGWMAENGVAAWLIPSEFMDVNYGNAVKHYLLHEVSLLHIHRFDPNDVQFADALVSSAVVIFRKAPPPAGHIVSFTFGGSLREPKLSRHVPSGDLAQEKKWTRFPAFDARSDSVAPTLADFFRIRRGLATGDNKFFMLTQDEIMRRGLPMEVFRPILPSPRHLPQDRVEADAKGLPQVEKKLFLLDVRMPESQIEKQYPALFEYLQEGRRKQLHDRYLCRHRDPWYAQEERPAPPLVCTYMGRSDGAEGRRPFRFILNLSQATAANVYLLLYPTGLLTAALRRDPSTIERVWDVLNSISADELVGEGRVYGGGLHKLEPKELANVRVPQLADIAQEPVQKLQSQLPLGPAEPTRRRYLGAPTARARRAAR